MSKGNEARWTKIAEEALVGRTIVGVRYLSAQETEDNAWDRRALVLKLDTGDELLVQSDDEGNGAGALHFIPSVGASFVLPTLR